MEDNKKQKFAITILIIFAIDLLMKYFFGSIYFSGAIGHLILYFSYVIGAILLLFNYKITGWYMAVFYFGYNLVTGLLNLTYMYTNLIENSDSNWGGILSFIFPLPSLIVYITAFILCVKKQTRDLYDVKL
ncbi:hypothetical protein [Sediminibacterium sp.]|uniref:hypothetical protein n=1 Tax=Sediminibacterium sp. TaxID=1917865 RepID=UPI002734FA42|nr:hypothetical protein [Sediminibacterium sp.]MDP3567387.1 hypothetical protein [Sediminibacterium sp.]